MLLTAGCFVLVALGVAAVAMISRNYAKQGTRQTETLTGRFLPGLITLARLQDSPLNLKSITFELALARDDAAASEHKRRFLAYTDEVNRGIAELRALAHDERIAELIAGFSAGVRSF